MFSHLFIPTLMHSYVNVHADTWMPTYTCMHTFIQIDMHYSKLSEQILKEARTLLFSGNLALPVID